MTMMIKSVWKKLDLGSVPPAFLLAGMSGAVPAATLQDNRLELGESLINFLNAKRADFFRNGTSGTSTTSSPDT